MRRWARARGHWGRRHGRSRGTASSPASVRVVGGRKTAARVWVPALGGQRRRRLAVVARRAGRWCVLLRAVALVSRRDRKAGRSGRLGAYVVGFSESAGHRASAMWLLPSRCAAVARTAPFSGAPSPPAKRGVLGAGNKAEGQPQLTWAARPGCTVGCRPWREWAIDVRPAINCAAGGRGGRSRAGDGVVGVEVPGCATGPAWGDGMNLWEERRPPSTGTYTAGRCPRKY